MSINALSSTSAASQLNFLNRLGGSNSSSGTEAVRRPPPPDGGGFADAIAEALKSIGVTDTSTSGTNGTTSTTSTGDTEATDGTDTVADALGSFLQSLMGALHAQNSGQTEAPSPYSEAAGKGGGGPGKLESDLQSLIAKLSSGGTATSADSTDDADAVSDLETTFQNLLDKLGGGSATADADGTDAGTKLAAFLEALSSKVGGSGASGNLVNTTV
ncbi:MAG TPA: hypothetical protein VN089_06470 [Duganella sp.]|nr:hypothetical protein [Duganella sp.]